MMRTMMKAKIHRATVTEANLEYEGSITIDPDLLEGSDGRLSEWHTILGVQQQLGSRAAISASYIRRSYFNFRLNDNLNAGPSDYAPYCVRAPRHPELPGGGGEEICGLYDQVSASLFAGSNLVGRKASDFGDMSYYWHGLDLTVDARTSGGVTLQGGFTSGAGHRDQCDIWAALPEQTVSLGVTYPVTACRTDEPWLWNWRGLASYVVPKVDVQISGIFRSQANVATTNDPASSGLSQRADYFETAANVRNQLGHGIAGGAPTVTLNLAPQGLVFPERLTTVDMRFTKILRIGRTRTNVGFDIYNILNSAPILTYNQAFNPTVNTVNPSANWLSPQSTLQPRFVKFSAQIDF